MLVIQDSIDLIALIPMGIDYRSSGGLYMWDQKWPEQLRNNDFSETAFEDRVINQSERVRISNGFFDTVNGYLTVKQLSSPIVWNSVRRKVSK